MKKKPIVAIKRSGRIADSYAGRYLDGRRLVRISRKKNVRQAVDYIM